MRELGRLLTAMVTPFDEKGAVDYEQAKKLALALLDSGSDGVVVAATTGEAPTVTWEEEMRLFTEVKSVVAGRGTIVAYTGSNSTAEAVEATTAHYRAVEAAAQKEKTEAGEMRELTPAERKKKKRLLARLENVSARYEAVTKKKRELIAANKILDRLATLPGGQGRTCAVVMGVGHERGLTRAIFAGAKGKKLGKVAVILAVPFQFE